MKDNLYENLRELDVTRIEAFENKLLDALESKETLKIEYVFENEVHICFGQISEIHPISKRFKVISPTNITTQVFLDVVTNIESSR
ncbi:YolD-like family protein [Alteribacter populi]|uniref:YolD-like family protein n=1 Tax=Alteribacter populi TaxID=2011011 RepID=UPI000BBADE4C|nr:YolD-like family protein [Alteribacter populi]